MVKRIIIHHPTPKSLPRGRDFPAFGITKGIKNPLAGCLIHHKTKKIIAGTIVAFPPRWMIQFEGATIGATYTLIIVEIARRPAVAFYPSITVQRPGKYKGGVQINFPIGGDKECTSNIVSYGYADNPVTGYFVNAQGVQWPAQAQAEKSGPPTTMYFNIQFPSDATPGTGYTIWVKDNQQPAASDHKNPIEIDNC
jgi:hypothetical protein